VKLVKHMALVARASISRQLIDGVIAYVVSGLTHSPRQYGQRSVQHARHQLGCRASTHMPGAVRDCLVNMDSTPIQAHNILS
jgi:hypothetical protein